MNVFVLASDPMMLVIGGLLLLLMGTLLYLVPLVNLWVQAFLAHTPIPLAQLVSMRLRRVKPAAIVKARILAAQAQIPGAELPALEDHCRAGGNVVNVVTALVTAARAGVPLDFARAAAMDLAGVDVVADTMTKAAAALAKSGPREHLGTRPPMGTIGVTLDLLRPSGYADFGDGKVAVVTRGERVARGVKVCVLESDARRVVVATLESLDALGP